MEEPERELCVSIAKTIPHSFKYLRLSLLSDLSRLPRPPVLCPIDINSLEDLNSLIADSLTSDSREFLDSLATESLIVNSVALVLDSLNFSTINVESLEILIAVPKRYAASGAATPLCCAFFTTQSVDVSIALNGLASPGESDEIDEEMNRGYF